MDKLNSWQRLLQHMENEHPTSSWFGDSTWTLEGETISQKCQICGRELIDRKEVKVKYE